ncbi:hypothetical protein HDV03_004381 [Kappamyces sp. JEL0829]|nr:hypothetical protein HDV03_004381 [Kappamyces sp. JEL0829]
MPVINQSEHHLFESCLGGEYHDEAQALAICSVYSRTRVAMDHRYSFFGNQQGGWNSTQHQLSRHLSEDDSSSSAISISAGQLSPFLDSICINGTVVPAAHIPVTFLIHSLPQSIHSIPGFLFSSACWMELSCELKWDSERFPFRHLVEALKSLAEGLGGLERAVLCLPKSEIMTPQGRTMMHSLSLLGFSQMHHRAALATTHILLSAEL